MGPSVSDLPKILLIVEGERREAASMQEGFVEVLNTSLFLPLDYFGAERFNTLFPME